MSRWKQFPSSEAAQILLIKFAEDYIWDAPGSAFIHTCLFGVDGTRYGSYKTVKQSDLYGRLYIVEKWNGAPSILLLDTIFDDKVPAEFAYHKLGQLDRLKRRRWKRYKRGELEYRAIYQRRGHDKIRIIM